MQQRAEDMGAETIDSAKPSENNKADVPIPDHGRWIVVSMEAHEIAVANDGVVERVIREFSTGRQGHLTPAGTFGIDANRRFRHHRSSTYNDSKGKPAEMPFALFFSGGCAFHAGDPNTASHGCIHLTLADAEWLFDWVGNYQVGVKIIGKTLEQPPLAKGKQNVRAAPGMAKRRSK